MDFITGLPKFKGYEAIFVIVDRLSKYAHFLPLKHPYTAKTLAEVFVKEIVRLHGVPISIVSDRDPIFMSQFWKEFFRLQGTTPNMGTTYHPQSDGQTEVINRCLETYLRCFVTDQPKEWCHWLPWVEYWYNTTFHESTQTTPFEVVYGRKPPSLIRGSQEEIRVEVVQREILDRDEALKQLKHHLQRAQERMKNQADLKRKERNFDIGDWVFLKLRPHRQKSVLSRINAKLSTRYYGPFEIIGRVGTVAYRLKLPETARIHPVFHVSLLKKAIGNYQVQSELPTGLGGDCVDTWVPITVLASRVVVKKGEQVKQWLIQWAAKPIEEATWEDVVVIRSQFPHLNLEDKITINGGGNDGDRVVSIGPEERIVQEAATKPKEWIVYKRKGKK